MNLAERLLNDLEKQNIDKIGLHFKQVKQNGEDEEILQAAEALSYYGYMNEALELYERLASQYPNESEFKLRLAELLIEIDREDEAIAYLASIHHQDEAYPAALLIEADLYEMQGLYEVSENKLIHAKDLLPEEPVVDFALGELYMTQGRFLEATRKFGGLLQANIEELAGVDINSRMAEALSAGGAFEESLPYYARALDHKKEIQTMFGYGLTAYQASEYKKAIYAFEQLKELDPDYHSLYLYLAKCYEHEEQLQEALETVKAGLQLDDFNKELTYFGGKLALKLGDEELAEQWLREALVLDPEYSEAGTTLNKLFFHQERYDDIIEISLQILAGENADPQYDWDLALSYQKTEEYEKALNHYELAYNDFNHNRDFLVDYGYFLLEEGKRKDAGAIFKQLLKQEPNNFEWTSVLEGLEE